MKIEKNHWYINDNSLSICLINYYVSIKPVLEGKLIWQTDVTDKFMSTETYYFDYLENAMDYVENELDIKKAIVKVKK